ncbi:MAG: MBL fold metallo-hydrolase [Sandaracinaceae bacterium]
MLFRQLFDHASSTYTYLVADPETREAALIDAVREQIDRDTGLLAELDLKLVYALETHVHADHVTASGLLRERLGARTVLSAAAGAGCPDILEEDGQVLELGALRIEARHTPGHTDGDVTYVVRDGDDALAFTGDTMLIRGCGRTDFQQGDAERLYDSVHQQIFSLPDETPIYPGHDYRGFTSTTVGEEKKLNRRLGGGTSKARFVQIMRDLKLAHPQQIDVAVPANLRCGLPSERPQGVVEVSEEWVREHANEVRLVDVREPAELQGDLGAMPGAELVPLDTLPGGLDAPTDAQIVVFCRSGGRSARAAQALADAGFTHVVSMGGGMARWNELGFPVIRAAEPQAAAEGACG